VFGDPDPFCRKIFEDLMAFYQGDWRKVMDHVKVRRIVLSEKDRVGVGTFQPKDEKNQDSTELTGDINYRKIAMYGSDSDPRAFNFDGELNIANRGICEFIEVLKLDVAFLYDLLGASQEHTIKPKKFAQTYIDEVILGHTNEPEYKRLQSNEMMEAFRDRTIKIDVPYNIRLDDEVRIYQKDFTSGKVRGVHIAPHTLEVAAMWAVLTRLEEPKKAGLTLMQKLKLYNGKSIPGYTEDSVRELKDEAHREGLGGISPRYIQDKVSNAMVSRQAIEERCINPFMVLNEIESGLTHHSLINDENTRKRYRELLAVVKEEYEDIIKGEVQRAISADEDAIKRLCTNYIESVRAYTQKERVKNKYTGRDEEPDERLMRSIEEKIEIPDSRKDDFRQEIMNYIGALSLDGKKFEYNTNARLYRALELKLFEDQRDTIKLKNLVSSVVDDETQQKIDIVKQRLIKNFGYNETSATDVLNYVASIFARGDSKTR
jgi:serine protein kinase